ncbi:helix-turn-helix transcriptional regulator [Flavobacterium beibuense]|uniref:helix-turn-helix transcriptional regulator n=1 Tax=Flavobacterium beibuense TaxID=657326 RepID=UPI003A943B5B
MNNYIGLNIKYLCSEKKLSQKEFGDLFEIKQGTVSGYIGGRTEPNITFLQNVSRHFKITIDDFINVDLSKQAVKKELQSTGHIEEPSERMTETGDPYILIESQKQTIEAQAKTIASQEKQITLLESIVAGNLKSNPKPKAS